MNGSAGAPDSPPRPLEGAASDSPPRPLEGIVVLDLGQVYGGPYCGLLLVHLGARVVKIEAPARGEPLRSGVGATATADPFAFQLLNGGKQSVTLDLKSQQGRERFLALARDADVVVENFAPGTTTALGVDYAAVSEVNPRIVYASLKAYGDDTPNRDLRGMDLTVQASSAAMSVNGFPEGPPMRCGPSLADFLGGTHLALGVLAALIERERTGRGQQVDVALQDAVIPALASNIAGWLTDPEHAPERTGNRHGGMRESPYNVYRTADGWVAILAISEPHWRSVAELIGREDLRDDPELADPLGPRGANRGDRRRGQRLDRAPQQRRGLGGAAGRGRAGLAGAHGRRAGRPGADARGADDPAGRGRRPRGDLHAWRGGEAPQPPATAGRSGPEPRRAHRLGARRARSRRARAGGRRGARREGEHAVAVDAALLAALESEIGVEHVACARRDLRRRDRPLRRGDRRSEPAAQRSRARPLARPRRSGRAGELRCRGDQLEPRAPYERLREDGTEADSHLPGVPAKGFA